MAQGGSRQSCPPQARTPYPEFHIVIYSSQSLDKRGLVNYRLQMIEVRQTLAFRGWFKGLKDLRAQARVQTRIDRLALGLFGDAKFFEGIGELRIDYGPGYRLYFTRHGDTIVILLCGGDKSTQKKDVKRALEMAREL